MIAVALSSRAIRAMERNARDGLTMEQIADLEGVSLATVKRDLEAVRVELDAATTAAAYVKWRHTRRERRRRRRQPETLELFG